MSKPNLSTRLHWIVLALGNLGMCLRQLLYTLGTDERGLLPKNHPLEIALWLLTAAALIFIALSVRKLDGAKDYEDNFFPSRSAAAGQFLAAAGVCVTVLPNAPLLPGLLGNIWKALGLLSVPCLLAAGVCRYAGKKPFFLLHMVPCLFLVFHIVNHYRLWSSQPQLQNYVFSLFGTMALALFAFYTAAFSADIQRRRMQLFTGLSAIYLCMTGLFPGISLWLYLGCLAWVFTGLCTLTPKPLPPQAAEDGKGTAL